MIIGHSKQRTLLDNMRRKNVPHALIFAGPEHVGKKFLAQAFFWLLERDEEGWDAFTTTDDVHGRRIRTGAHPDMLVLGEEKDITAEQAREIRTFVGLSPFELPRKLVLIDNAEELGTVGFNTLLKTFEEPASNTTIILVTDRPEMLPDTITSRAATIRFSHIDEKVLLEGFSNAEKKKLKTEQAWIAGRPGLAFRYLKDNSDPQVYIRKKYYKAFKKALSEGGVAVRLTLAEEVAKLEQPILALEAFSLAAREALTTEKAPHAMRRLYRIKEGIEQLRFTNVNTRLALEHALLSTEPLPTAA